MKNEIKLGFFIFAIIMVAAGFGWAFNLSLNPQTFQVGYTVYSEKGEIKRGFIPNQKQIAAADANCPSSCSNEATGYALQCREHGFQAYAGPCCETLCSGKVGNTEATAL